MSNHTGQCLCGESKYQISAEPVMAGVCHCRNCQRQAGSAFSTLWGVPKAAVTFSGRALKSYEDKATTSGTPLQRFFCDNCGSPIYSELPGQPDLLFIKTGTLDNADDFVPTFHLWGDTKQPWVTIPEGMPVMPRQS